MPLNAGIDDIANVIQLAIAPVFLLAAVGALIGVLTVRLAHAADRTRLLEEQQGPGAHGAVAPVASELRVLRSRMRLIDLAVALDVICALFVGLTIVIAFRRGIRRPEPGMADCAAVRGRHACLHRQPRGVPARDLPGRRACLRHGPPMIAALRRRRPRAPPPRTRWRSAA